MRLYIVRHGKASDAPVTGRLGGSGGADPDYRRELTPRGEAQAQFLGSRLRNADVRPSLIVSSPYPRAQQTAEVCQRALGCELRFSPSLKVDYDVSEALAVIEAHREVRALMLVGHNPQLGELLSVLAQSLSPRDMMLRTGELVALEARPNQFVGTARIVGRLRLSETSCEDSVVGGVFAVQQA